MRRAGCEVKGLQVSERRITNRLRDDDKNIGSIGVLSDVVVVVGQEKIKQGHI